ncbi:hypothetical protein Q9Q_02853 [Enterococcus faecalis EnGen0078]|uniref:hypothetical protein n=1 Tax=Enterococcus faecalis TaxID=1351 RepID=UPI00032EA378|nr:hypothetical protein [Enterococcus faecalis]EOE05038.1 hypothetical protein Q9Q_02853 [Enterococcus faecalis EnGen0078]EOK32124.1 hypothetical protein WU9_00943 [Enterococcus faecalis EnGen0334]NRC86975.1 hypothetical protein [Enterococcus faecalis]
MVVLSENNTFVLKMPKYIYLKFPCIDKILSIAENREKNKNNIALDFSNTSWIDAEATPFLGVLVQKLQDQNLNIYAKLPENKNVVQILEKNGFLSAYGLSKNKLADVYGTTIPYSVLNSHNDSEIDEFLENRVFKLIHKYIKKDEIEIIRDAINEISHNVKDHSTQPLLYFCGQFYPQKKYIALTLTDNGITIPKKIKHKFSSKINQSDFALIEWATGQGNSTKNVASSGLGLFDIKSNIEGIGEFTILSNYGYWEQKSDGTKQNYTLSTPYPGTLISLKFLTYDNESRIYSSENDIINKTKKLLF